jgi:hypothetical protein
VFPHLDLLVDLLAGYAPTVVVKLSASLAAHIVSEREILIFDRCLDFEGLQESLRQFSRIRVSDINFRKHTPLDFPGRNT